MHKSSSIVGSKISCSINHNVGTGLFSLVFITTCVDCVLPLMALQ